MCTGAELIPIGAALLGSVASQALSKKPEQAPTPAQLPELPASQAAGIPAAQNRQSGSPNASDPTGQGQASTLLTGLGGVDPKSLSLGKNTLLGA